MVFRFVKDIEKIIFGRFGVAAGYDNWIGIQKLFTFAECLQ